MAGRKTTKTKTEIKKANYDKKNNAARLKIMEGQYKSNVDKLKVITRKKLKDNPEKKTSILKEHSKGLDALEKRFNTAEDKLYIGNKLRAIGGPRNYTKKVTMSKGGVTKGNKKR